MDCLRMLRSIATMLLLCFYVASLWGPVSALAMPGVEEEEVFPFDYAHPAYRGLKYGTKWNYSLTFNYATRPLWLYGNNRKILFRQKLESGRGTGDTQLTLWVRYAYDELAICLEPEALDVLARAGVRQILLRNGSPGDPPEKEVLYQVEDLQQLMAQAGVESEKVLQLWLGESGGPRLILKTWARIQMNPEDDPGQVP